MNKITFNHKSKSVLQAVLLNGKSPFPKDKKELASILSSLDEFVIDFLKERDGDGKTTIIDMIHSVDQNEDSLVGKARTSFLLGFNTAKQSNKISSHLLQNIVRCKGSKLSNVVEEGYEAALESKDTKRIAYLLAFYASGGLLYVSSHREKVITPELDKLKEIRDLLKRLTDES